MKISELVHGLEQLKRVHGDLEVVAYEDESGFFCVAAVYVDAMARHPLRVARTSDADQEPMVVLDGTLGR